MFEVHPAIHPPFTEYPVCARSPVRGRNVKGKLQDFDNDLYMAGSDQHVKCCRIVNRKCYGWHSVGIVGVELRVNLESEGQIEDLSAPRKSRKPAGQSEWVPSVVSIVEKGSSPSEGDLVGCAPRPQVALRLIEEKRLVGHSLGVWKRRVKRVSGWKALLCGFPTGDLDLCSFATR